MKQRNRGVTLVELMFALAIIAIAMFAILSVVVQTMAMRDAARETQTAKEWVSQKIEEVKSQSFADLKNSVYQPAGGTTVYSANFSGVAVSSQLHQAAGILTVDYTNVNLYEIIASVEWKGRLGKGAYSMRSLYSK